MQMEIVVAMFALTACERGDNAAVDSSMSDAAPDAHGIDAVRGIDAS